MTATLWKAYGSGIPSQKFAQIHGVFLLGPFLLQEFSTVPEGIKKYPYYHITRTKEGCL